MTSKVLDKADKPSPTTLRRKHSYNRLGLKNVNKLINKFIVEYDSLQERKTLVIK